MELFTATGSKKVGAGGIDGMGTYQARPAANAVRVGYVYKATNAGTYVSDGTSWLMISPGFFSVSNAGLGNRVSAAYGHLNDAQDLLSQLYLPPGGKFVTTFQARWGQGAGALGARAAIFLGANQLKVADQYDGVATQVAAALSGDSAQGGAANCPLSSVPWGLHGGGTYSGGGAAYAGDANTGQAFATASRTPQTSGLIELVAGGTSQMQSASGWEAFGGPCEIFAAAGLYDVSVQYKNNTAGVSVVAQDRKLIVEVWGN